MPHPTGIVEFTRVDNHDRTTTLTPNRGSPRTAAADETHSPRINLVKTAHFDCFSGASGDMILGALIDAGLDPDDLKSLFSRIPVEGYAFAAEKVNTKGFAATRVTISLDASQKQPHRHLHHITEIIENADLPQSVRNRAKSVFTRLATAEAAVHGSTIEKVHFHEVGAVDAILDIVGACYGLDRLGIGQLTCSPLATGCGTVQCEHGLMPVPAPATANLIRGVPVVGTDVEAELLTPTGAAILTEFAQGYGSLPAMTVDTIGIGAGQRDLPRPNILRLFTGTSADHARPHASVTILEANIDDTTPEILGYTIERLLKEGALDAYCLPIHMKKSRPAHLLAVIAEPDSVARLENVIFAETTTLGIRRHDAERSCVTREIQAVQTPYGDIRMKIGIRHNEVITAAPEFEDCRVAAEKHGVPLQVVMTAAGDAYRKT